MNKVVAALSSDSAKQFFLDLIGMAGLGSLCFGAFQIYEPAAPIVGGFFLMVFALKASK